MSLRRVRSLPYSTPTKPELSFPLCDSIFGGLTPGFSPSMFYALLSSPDLRQACALVPPKQATSCGLPIALMPTIRIPPWYSTRIDPYMCLPCSSCLRVFLLRHAIQRYKVCPRQSSSAPRTFASDCTLHTGPTVSSACPPPEEAALAGGERKVPDFAKFKRRHQSGLPTDMDV